MLLEKNPAFYVDEGTTFVLLFDLQNKEEKFLISSAGIIHLDILKNYVRTYKVSPHKLKILGLGRYVPNENLITFYKDNSLYQSYGYIGVPLTLYLLNNSIQHVFKKITAYNSNIILSIENIILQLSLFYKILKDPELCAELHKKINTEIGFEEHQEWNTINDAKQYVKHSKFDNLSIKEIDAYIDYQETLRWFHTASPNNKPELYEYLKDKAEKFKKMTGIQLELPTYGTNKPINSKNAKYNLSTPEGQLAWKYKLGESATLYNAYLKENPDDVWTNPKTDIAISILQHKTTNTYNILISNDTHGIMIDKYLGIYLGYIDGYNQIYGDVADKSATYFDIADARIGKSPFGNYDTYLSFWIGNDFTGEVDNVIYKLTVENALIALNLINKLLSSEMSTVKYIEFQNVAININLIHKIPTHILNKLVDENSASDKHLRFNSMNEITEYLKNPVIKTEKLRKLQNNIAKLTRLLHTTSPFNKPEIQKALDSQIKLYKQIAGLSDKKIISEPINTKYNLSTPEGQLAWKYKLGESATLYDAYLKENN